MSSLDERFYEAINNCDPELATHLLQLGANVNSQLQSGRTPLCRAVQLGFKKIIEILLNGPSTSTENATSDFSDIYCPLLTRQSCDVNQPDYYDRTPVHYAAELGCTDILKILLQAGCKTDVADSENITPLHLAACRGHESFVEILLHSGCRVNRKTSDKTSALHIAASRGFPGIVDKLIQYGAKMDSLDTSDRTPLLLAVNRGHKSVVQCLINHGAKVNMEEIHGYTPLAEAVWLQDPLLVEILLTAGAKITNSHHLLHHAIANHNEKIAKLLIQAGSVVNLHDDNGNRPLHLAIPYFSLPIINLLLKNDAFVNLPNSITGVTVLHEAVSNCPDDSTFETILTLFMQYGCKLNEETTTPGDTPLYEAILSDKFGFAEILIRHGADVNSGGLYTCPMDNMYFIHRKNNLRLAQLLVQAGYDLKKLTWLESLVRLETKQLEDECAPVTAYLLEVRQNARNLSDICRIVIRQHLQYLLYQKIKDLPLPERLKTFLRLEDF